MKTYHRDTENLGFRNLDLGFNNLRQHSARSSWRTEIQNPES